MYAVCVCVCVSVWVCVVKSVFLCVHVDVYKKFLTLLSQTPHFDTRPFYQDS